MLDDAYKCPTNNTRLCRSMIASSSSDLTNLEMNMATSGSYGATLELTGRFCFAPDLMRYCNSDVNVKKLFNFCGPQFHTYNKCDSVRYGKNAQVEHYGLKGRLVPYLFKPNPSIANLSNVFTHCKFVGSYVKDYTDETGTKSYAYPIPESFIKYLTSKNLDLTETFMGWYFPANTNLNVFKNDIPVTYNLNSTFQWPLFSNRICTSGAIDKKSFVNFPATEVYGIFNDDGGYVRASSVKKVFNCSQSETNKETSTSLVRNQSVRFSGVFSTTGYTMGTDTYCFAGYTNPLAESADWGIRFPSKSVRTDEEFRNYIEYAGELLE
jgi:hypothetical protein